jgi:hypothetical protein
LIIVSARIRLSPVVQTNFPLEKGARVFFLPLVQSNFPGFEGYIQINQSCHTIVTSSRMRWGGIGTSVRMLEERLGLE